jgi:hypothetical protein
MGSERLSFTKEARKEGILTKMHCSIVFWTVQYDDHLYRFDLVFSNET